MEWQPTPAFLPGKSHGQRSLADYSPWGHKEYDMTETNTMLLGYAYESLECLHLTFFSKWLSYFTAPEQGNILSVYH